MSIASTEPASTEPASTAGTTSPITLLMFPSGMPVALFAALTDLIGTALGEDADVVLRAPAAWQDNSTVTVNNLTAPQITRRLRAAAGDIDGSPRPELEDTDGLPVVVLGSGIEFGDSDQDGGSDSGGVEIALGFDDATREQGQAMLGAIAKTISEELVANPGAVNYLEWSWFDPQNRATYRLIGVRPGQPTPHELRVAADAECDRLRQLLADHGIDPQ